MIEVNPWSPNKALRDANMFRGAIVGAWAYVETVLIEIAIRSSHMDEYCSIRETFPYRGDRRINYLRQMLRADGPFSRYQNLGMQFLSRYEATEELRHIMAHGRMTVLGKAEFTYFSFQKGRPIQKCSIRLTIAELEEKAREAARLSRLLQRLFWTVDNKGILPPL
jgi:hypothetical protein